MPPASVMPAGRSASRPFAPVSWYGTCPRSGRRRIAAPGGGQASTSGTAALLTLGAASAAAAIVAGIDLLWPVIAAPLLFEGLSSLLQAKILVPLVPTLARSTTAGRLTGSASTLPAAVAGVAAALPLGDRWPEPAKDRAGILGGDGGHRRALRHRLRTIGHGSGGAGDCPRCGRRAPGSGPPPPGPDRHSSPPTATSCCCFTRPARHAAWTAAGAAATRGGRRGCSASSLGTGAFSTVP